MLGQARADAARERDELRAASEARIRAAEAARGRREREHAAPSGNATRPLLEDRARC